MAAVEFDLNQLSGGTLSLLHDICMRSLDKSPALNADVCNWMTAEERRRQRVQLGHPTQPTVLELPALGRQELVIGQIEMTTIALRLKQHGGGCLPAMEFAFAVARVLGWELARLAAQN